MERSVGAMWPRAASVVYEEPKRLVRLGLAGSTKEYTGNRASTVYSITDAGRRRWPLGWPNPVRRPPPSSRRC